MGADGRTKQYYTDIKKRTIKVLESVISNDSNNEAEEIRKIDEALFNFFIPQKFDGSNGMEVKFLRGMEETCILLSQHISRDPKKMTVFEFYQAFQTIKEQIKAKNKK